jgi:DeoR/GlpR family transcriptional regulator of sugar metabolism
MLANERHSIIVECVNSKGAVTVSELTNILDISTETLRRDLIFLEKQNQLRRVHGGAVALTSTKRFSSLSQRLNENVKQKRQLSQIAAGLISEGDVIAIDSGSTASEFVPVIKNRFKNLTVITHSVSVFEQLKDKEGFKLILIGGEYLHSENVFYGTLATETIKKLHASTCFIFPSAISLKYGVADYVSEVIPIQKSYMNISNRVVIMADSSKFEKTALLRLCDTNSNYTFVTSDDLDENVYTLYLNNKIKLLKQGGPKQ